MKTLLIICSTFFLTTSGFSATYEVPVAFGLKRLAKFQLENFEKKLDGDKMEVSYDLPKALTGTTEHIVLTGSKVKGSDDYVLAGDKGIANCTDEEYKLCNVEYYNLNIDTEAAKKVNRDLSQNNLEFALRLRVMRSFSSEPVGIIKY